jgi:hypothetical protein
MNTSVDPHQNPEMLIAIIIKRHVRETSHQVEDLLMANFNTARNIFPSKKQSPSEEHIFAYNIKETIENQGSTNNYVNIKWNANKIVEKTTHTSCQTLSILTV